MKPQKKLSIIIPVYNAEKFLHRCIESFIHQIDDRTEVILVNDGSTDKSGEICDEYESKYSCIKVVNRENGGEGAARNTGIKNSSGEWILFVDADDALVPQFYKIISKYWGDKAEWLLFNAYKLNDSDSIEGLNENVPEPIMMNDCPAMIKSSFLGEAYCKGDGYCSYRGPVGTLVCKRIIDDYGVYFDEGVKIGTDMLFMLKYLSHTSSVNYIPMAIYLYYYNPASITNRYKPDFQEIVDTYINAITPWLKTHPEYEIYHGFYRLNDIILYLKYDFFHKENTEGKDSQKIRMRQIFAKYMGFYRQSKEENLLKKYPLNKRIVLFFALHGFYLPLKLIFKIKYN